VRLRTLAQARLHALFARNVVRNAACNNNETGSAQVRLGFVTRARRDARHARRCQPSSAAVRRRGAFRRPHRANPHARLLLRQPRTQGVSVLRLRARWRCLRGPNIPCANAR